MHDGAEGAGLCAHAAGFAFVRINVHLIIARMNGVESACVQAGFSQTEAAAVGHGIFMDRTVITRGRDDSNDIFGRFQRIGTLPHGKTDPSANDLTLFIYTAAVLGLGARAYFINDLFQVFGSQRIIPCKRGDFTDNVMFQVNDTFIICNHI